MSASNPNGANQFNPDPRQSLFLASYTDPKSKTFGNALQSALNAGYSQEYAENITSQMPEWLAEKLGDLRRLKKAEKNLEEILNLEIKDDEGKTDIPAAMLRTKVDMFIAERLDKTKYSTRNELTGKDGESITVELIKYGTENKDSAQLSS